jgi:hypothetical protein
MRRPRRVLHEHWLQGNRWACCSAANSSLAGLGRRQGQESSCALVVVEVMPRERCGSTTEQSDRLICRYDHVQGRQVSGRDDVRTLSVGRERHRMPHWAWMQWSRHVSVVGAWNGGSTGIQEARATQRAKRRPITAREGRKALRRVVKREGRERSFYVSMGRPG